MADVISEEAIERLDKIFDKTRKIETDSDLLELAELVEDESKDEKDDIHDGGGADAGDRSDGSTAADRA